MWNKHLAARTQHYSSAVLSIVDANGYPFSVRCRVCLNEAGHVFTFPTPPPQAVHWQGKACLLFHQHNERLEGLKQLVILGELGRLEGQLTFQVSTFVTSNGRKDTDQMPHAASPLHLLRFLWTGWRNARAYLAKRTTPWPAIPYEEFHRLLAEELPS